MPGSQRNFLVALGLVTLLLLGVAFSTVSHRGGTLAGASELLEEDAHTRRLENALHTLEGKLHSAGAHSSVPVGEEGNLLMHAAPESSGLEEPTEVPEAGEAGAEWTSEDQEAYDKEISRAVGTTGREGEQGDDKLGLPAGFLPMESSEQQAQYALSLVKVLKNLKGGYWDELLGWAAEGGDGENPYISPIVEAIEAPLVKELDSLAHAKVSKAVQEIAVRKDLKPAQMKEMRTRLLVPLLLRIRARVHKKVERYTVGMIRRVILDDSDGKGSSGGGDSYAGHGIVPPSAGSVHKPTVDEDMEYALRDIDTLYSKGALSERDYEAEKAKVLSEWLGDAIKSIGGKSKARRALREFLWPPLMTQMGCRCLMPFPFLTPGLKNLPIVYEAPTDIGEPGHAWCAVDPVDATCGYKSTDPRATLTKGGYGWTHWDYTQQQPGPPLPQGELPDHFPKRIETVLGCKCKMPFEVYPKVLGGKIKHIYGTCTREYGQGEDWCATEGDCGRSGNPTGQDDPRLTWSHWDKCIGEPAGWLEPPKEPIITVQNCTCMDEWEFKPADLKLQRISYGGCTDVDDPGHAWCAVKGEGCGNLSEDPRAGYGGNKYGWTKWDYCSRPYQPIKVMADIEKEILPYPLPFVRTRRGCECILPFKLPSGDMSYSCSRYGSYQAWCPVSPECGNDGVGPHGSHLGMQVPANELGWAHWDSCVGDPPGFLPPARPLVTTKMGCVCKALFDYAPQSLGGVVVPYEACTDIGSPGSAWCAVDVARSPPGCGQDPADPKANLGKGGYGWDKWDECAVQPEVMPLGQLPAGPEPVVKTLKGCRCALPYKLSPHGTGMRNIVEATCNRFEPSEYGVTPYYWCPTVGDCGDVLDEPADGHTHFDKCIGEETGFLEPEPTMTEQGCHCILPFLFEPKSFRNMDDKMMVYTECTDTGAVADQSAWCAVKGHCGRRSRRSKAHKEEGGYGWTHWDFCKKQPEVRSLLPSGQPKLPSPAPLVRTKNGCSCKLPFPYAPAKDCAVEKETDGCEARGGYMMSGFCVVCKVSTWTICIRADQEAPWCAVDGNSCGTKSEDVLAIDGSYGWTHWDHCMGEPAGYEEHKPRRVKKAKASTWKGSDSPVLATSHHGVTVTGIEKLHRHAGEEHEEDGGVEESKGARGRSAIRELETQMASSIHKLNTKIADLHLNATTDSSAITGSAPSVLISGLLALLVLASSQLL